MTDLEGKIKLVLDKHFDMRMYTTEELAEEIAVAISEDDSGPELLITPGDWYVDEPEMNFLLVRRRGGLDVIIAELPRKVPECEANAKAIAALPKILLSGREVVIRYHSDIGVRPHVKKLKEALEEAGIDIGHQQDEANGS